MAAVWARVRAELRRRVAGTLLLILFLGMAGGAVLGALAGARRTDTAYPRMRDATAAGDVLVSVEKDGDAFYAEVAALPQVVAFGVGVGLDVLVEKGPESVLEGGFLPALAARDNKLNYEVGRPRVTAGRLPDPDRPDEAFANRFLAQLGVRPGTVLELRAVRPDDEPPPEKAPAHRITVVGTGIFQNEVLPIAVNDSQVTLFLTSAFYRQYAGPEFDAFDGGFARLRPGTDVSRFRSDVEAAIERHPEAGGLLFLSEEERTDVVLRAVRPQVVALQLFALLTALTTVLLVGQALARQLYGDATDYPTMRALGMTRRQLFAVGMLRTALVGVGGAVVAVTVAIATSPLMPLGTAKLAEPDPGLRVNVALLGLGAIAIVVVLMLAIFVPATLRSRARATAGAADPGRSRPSRLAGFLARSGAPTPMTVGVRMAVDPGRGRASAPVRSATVGTVLAVATLAATVTFGSSLDRLVNTPRLYGQTWDFTVNAGFGTIPAQPASDRLRDSPDVDEFSGGVVGELSVDGVPVPAIGIDRAKGNVTLPMLEGRVPAGPGEIALGSRTLRNVGARVGDMVEIEAGDVPAQMLVVGRAVFPQFGLGSFRPTSLGDGALVTASALPLPEGGVGYNVFLIRLKSPRDRAAGDRVFRAATAGIPECDAGFCGTSPSLRPGDVTNFARVRSTPLILASLLALLAAAATGHALVSSVRRRGRELAILKTVGFVGRQVGSVVAWQATTLIMIALAVGIPAGVAVGRAVWLGFADRMGIPPEPVVPLALIVSSIPVALAIANAVAALPGMRAARLSPAVVLRDG